MSVALEVVAELRGLGPKARAAGGAPGPADAEECAPSEGGPPFDPDDPPATASALVTTAADGARLGASAGGRT